MIKYKNQAMLTLFIITLLICQISFIVSETPNTPLFIKKLPFFILIFSMVLDVFIASGAIHNTKYLLHHVLTAVFALIALIDLDLLTGIGIGYFCCYALFGATVKRIRMLRHRLNPRHDQVDSLLKFLYGASNRGDLFVIPAYLILYLLIKSDSTSTSVLAMLSIGTILLLFLRYTVDHFHNQHETTHSAHGLLLQTTSQGSIHRRQMGGKPVG